MSHPIVEARAVDMSFTTRKGPLTVLENFRLQVQPGEVSFDHRDHRFDPALVLCRETAGHFVANEPRERDHRE